jgi:hypothetical protein
VWDRDAILEDIESPSLKKDLVEHLFADIVEAVPLMRLCEASTQRDICLKLRSIFRMPGRVVTKKRTVPDFLYIIRFGQVSMKGWGYQTYHLERGDVFGELALLGLSPDGLRMRTATVQSVCELCQLAKQDLNDLLVQRPGLYNIIKEICRMHLRGLAQAKDCMSMISASHAFDYSGLSDPRQPLKDFYQHLCVVEWRSFCAVIKCKQDNEARRNEMSHFDDAKIRDIESAYREQEPTYGGKMLCTYVSLSLKSLSLVPQQDNFATDVADGNTTSVILVAKWRGVEHLPLTCVQNESTRFPFNRSSGAPRIAQNFQLPVTSPHGVPWRDLESLDFGILSAPKSASHSTATPVRANDNAGGRHAHECSAEPTGNICSILEPNATLMFTGKLAMKDLLIKSNRDLPAHKQPRYAKASVLLSSPDQDGMQAKLEIDVMVKRRARCPMWRKLTHIVAARGASPFFAKKLDKLYDSVMAQEVEFGKEIRNQRLSRMTTISAANNDLRQMERKAGLWSRVARVNDAVEVCVRESERACVRACVRASERACVRACVRASVRACVRACVRVDAAS